MASRSASSRTVGIQRLRATSTRRSHSKKSSSRSHFQGGRIAPSINPPQVTYQPWYPLTLVFSHTSGKVFTPAKIVNQIRAQLDPQQHGFIPATLTTPQFRLQFRVLSIRTWNLTGRQIALSVNDFTARVSSGSEQLCGIVDTGTALHVPCCGFRLPETFASIVLRNDNDDMNDALADVIAPAGNSCMTYIDVMWRFDGPVKLVAPFQTDMYKLLINQQKTRQVLEESAATLAHISQVADETRPTFVGRVVDGLVKTAEVVAIAGGAVEVDGFDQLLDKVAKLSLLLESSCASLTRLEKTNQHPASPSEEFSDLSDSLLLEPDTSPDA